MREIRLHFRTDVVWLVVGESGCKRSLVQIHKMINFLSVHQKMHFAIFSYTHINSYTPPKETFLPSKYKKNANATAIVEKLGPA